MELQKLYNVKFKSGTYENESACCNFLVSISDFLMDKNIEDLWKVIFFALLCDGSTDHSIIEQEVVYVAYCNPKTFELCLKYFHLASPKDSQDTPGLKRCTFDAFKEHKVGDLIPKMVFWSSDGASVNSRKHFGLIWLIQEEFPWVPFIWCFSHCLELARKDSLKSFIGPMDESLLHLFYLYKNSSKKVRELKNLYQILKEQFETWQWY